MMRLNAFRPIAVALVATVFPVSVRAQGPDPSAVIQNAVLEGIQLTQEPGKVKDEKIVTCYFIFRDKPSSYFYDKRQKQKKVVFEFNDTEMGSSPIPSMAEAPITGFEIERKRVDVNAEIRGLKPEWHDLVSVTFSLNDMPQITVNDQFNIISFSYPWSSDPSKADQYAVKEKKPPIIPISIAGGGGAALAIITYLVWPKPEPRPDGPVPIYPLPQHKPWNEQ